MVGSCRSGTHTTRAEWDVTGLVRYQALGPERWVANKRDVVQLHQGTGSARANLAKKEKGSWHPVLLSA